jgi:hypothetical protein
MEEYDYYDAVMSDVMDFIEENGIQPITAKDRSEAVQELYDRLVNEDNITGLASSSYTCNRRKAEEYLCHNWGLVAEMADATGIQDLFSIGAEMVDVHLRCHVLYSVVQELVRNMMNGRSWRDAKVEPKNL